MCLNIDLCIKGSKIFFINAVFVTDEYFYSYSHKKMYVRGPPTPFLARLHPLIPHMGAPPPDPKHLPIETQTYWFSCGNS